MILGGLNVILRVLIREREARKSKQGEGDVMTEAAVAGG